MANNFVIRKGLIVSGSTSQSFDIQGTTGQRFTVVSSSQGNILSVSNVSGIPLLKVSGSGIMLGTKTPSGSTAIAFSQEFLQVTGSATLTNLTLAGDLSIQGNVAKSGSYSYAHGSSSLATGSYSHAQGHKTIALGDYSHAEGLGSYASQSAAHTEGYFTSASGEYSHAEGSGSLALGISSHAEGIYTTASKDYQHTTGQYTAPSPTSFFIHGNGISNSNRSNLINVYGEGINGIVEISGSLKIQGDLQGSIGTTIDKQTTTAYTITNEDTGKELLFTNPTTNNQATDNCDITFPAAILTSGFAVTLTTLDQTLFLITGSGVVFVNNIGNGLGMKSSVTIISTGTTNEYLTLGDL